MRPDATMRQWCRRTIRLAAVASIAVGTSLTALAATARAGATAPVRSPVSVSFVSATRGWAIVESRCHGSFYCPSLIATTDAGRHWTAEPLPTALATGAWVPTTYGLPANSLDVDFADASNGWIYGQVTQVGATAAVPVLWVTHDGGLTWHRVDLAGLKIRYGILTMSAARGVVHALGILASGSAAIWSSPVSTDAWRRTSPAPMPPPAGGGNLVAAIVLRGASGWAVFGNDRGITGAARLTASGNWAWWTPPCSEVGDAFTVPVAFSPTSLAAICQIGGFGGTVRAGHLPPGARLGDQWIFTSHDGGRTFSPHTGTSFHGISAYLNFVPGTYAMPKPGVVVLWDTTNGSTVGVIERSVDWGRTWRVARVAASLASFVSDGGIGPWVNFLTPSVGLALVQTTRSSSVLLRSTDGGASWRPVTI